MYLLNRFKFDVMFSQNHSISIKIYTNNFSVHEFWNRWNGSNLTFIRMWSNSHCFASHSLELVLTGRIQFFVIHVRYLSGVNSDPLRKAGHALMFSSLSLLFLKRKRKRRAEGPIHPSGVPGDVNESREVLTCALVQLVTCWGEIVNSRHIELILNIF